MPVNESPLHVRQARVFKAIAHPLRVAILEYLRAGEHCVCKIAEHVGAERSNVSRHLGMMVNAGVLCSRKEGLKVIYGIRAQCVTEALDCVRRLIEQQLRQDASMIGCGGLDKEIGT